MMMDTSIVLLERLSALIQQSLREDAAHHGLQPIHVQILAYLAQANRYSDIPIAIAEYFGITRGTVSQSLAVLERKGLLVKVRDASHGRRVHLKLTRTGKAVLKRSWAERVDEAVSLLPSGTVPLNDTLRALLAGLQRLNGQRAFGICHQCAHFLTENQSYRCGLTSEPLAKKQTVKICREWTALNQQAD